MTSRTTPSVDQAARDLVSRDGLHRTLFVEAGAGTGKTTQLVARIVNLVVIDDVPLSRIVAITFTEAAATELQSRIRVELEKRAASDADPEVAGRCRRALADADRAAISTLHGFANRLLGELSLHAGLPPRVTVLDEITSQLAHEERWARFVDDLYADPVHEAVLRRAALLQVPLEPRYDRHVTFKDVASQLRDNWDRLEPVAARTPPPITPVDVTPIERAVHEVLIHLDDCTTDDDLLLRLLVDSWLPTVLGTLAIDDPDLRVRHLKALELKGALNGRKANWPDIDAVKAAARALRDSIGTVVQRSIDEVLEHLLVLVARHVLDAAARRRDEGGLEFHDLLVLARDMLRRDAEVRALLHARYTHLLLDEFQDTDPIQIELAVLIASSIADAPVPAWHELDVPEGRLFFVGDPKQSIYRFRRADISLFLQARDRFGPDRSWARLTTNFRTVAPVLDWVNDLFGTLMATEVAGGQPQYEPLHAHRVADSGADHRPILFGGPHDDPDVRAPQVREAEARDVARIIDDIRRRPHAWPVDVGRGGGWRDATLADVTILVPTRTSLPYLRTALEDAAVPYRLATGTLVYDSQEVRDALAAVRAIDDVTDQLSLVAALRSPLYACSDVDLFTFRRAGGRWDLRVDPPDAVPADQPVRLALAHLRSLWRDRWWLTPSTLLERLLRERHALLLGFGDPRPTEVWRRLRFLVDQARAFEESGGAGLRAFVDWAELQGADRARVHEPLLPETDDDAVRIMTIHGAKGLEFPITILTGMSTAPASGRAGVSLLWEGTHPSLQMGKGVTTSTHEPRADLEAEMDHYEKDRLLYVAATRARDHLLVSCHHRATHGGPKSYAGRVWHHGATTPTAWRGLADALDGGSAGGLGEPGAGAAGAAGAVDTARGSTVGPPSDGARTLAAAPMLPFDDRAGWIARREAALAPWRVSRTVSATAVARAAGHHLDRDDVSDDDLADQADDPVPVPRRRGRVGSAVGRAVHATLQLVDLASPHDVEALVRRQCDAEAVPDLEHTVLALVRSALASEAVALAARSVHHKELYVAAPLGDRVVEGYVDLLVETPAGLVVIDYKTDTAASEADIEAKLAGYELQAASYAVALEAVTGLPVAECRFVFCRGRGAVERTVRDLPAAMQRVRDAVAAGAGGPPPHDGPRRGAAEAHHDEGVHA